MELEQKLIGSIEGLFRIEAYQRGYRWSNDEIIHLLEDIDEIPNGQPYCLQPVVVKNVGVDQTTGKTIYELIDGQQRMTTLFLIMKCLTMHNAQCTMYHVQRWFATVSSSSSVMEKPSMSLAQK